MSSPTPKTFQGKVALVTGAGRGIGSGIARELSARGASVVINYRGSAEGAESLVKEITAAGSDAIAIKADVSKVEEIKALFQKAKEHFKKIDIVVSNSGIEHFGALLKVTPEDFDNIFNVNTRGQFFVAQQAFEHLSDGGRLILMSSISARAGVREHAVYSGSKAAVEAFTRNFAVEFGPRGITVNCIAPGGTKTDMATENGYKYIPMADASWSFDKIEAAVSRMTPLGRIADPIDVARVVAFLASEDAGWVNGQIITISGGAAL